MHIAEALFIALVAAGMCGVGVCVMYQQPLTRSHNEAEKVSGSFRRNKKAIVSSMITGSIVSIAVLIWTSSAIITFPFSFFSTLITFTYLRSKAARNESAVAHVWPEVIDHLISGIHSGLSLSEAMVGLGARGPEILRPAFAKFHQELLREGNFSLATQNLKTQFNSHSSDQILEAVLLAKSLGGSELLQIFRTLGDFLRQDLSLRKEIEIKHGWIRNSAHLSSAAPWLLLLLLSSQPGTAQSFAQPTGIAILCIGILLTLTAYFWMGRLGRLPKTPRVFS